MEPEAWIPLPNGRCRVDRFPNQCPACHHALHVPPFGCGLQVPGKWLQAVFECPKCERLFIASYVNEVLGGCTPQVPIPPVLPKRVAETFPNFVQIFSQAYAAEQKNLDQVCGPGYRKALEFLIKGYLIHVDPTTEAFIRETALANCIKHHLKDTDIADVAEKAVHLGNDETHFDRKWETVDIEILKELISLTINYVDNKLGVIHWRGKSLVPARKSPA